MKKTIKTKSRAQDKNVFSLVRIRRRKEQLITDEKKLIKQIRDGFRESVVMFIDMVDSTKFKTDHKAKPEKWILRVRQFSELVSTYVEECGGTVVKYIGDSVMAVFNHESKINDTLNLLNRIDEIQNDLLQITKAQTQIKIAVDFGKVIYLEYDGHETLDPQGTPVDRCARIEKHCPRGTAVTTISFVEKCKNKAQWKKTGEHDLKGIGLTDIYQFGDEATPLVATPKIKIVPLDVIRKETNVTEIEAKVLRLKAKLNARKPVSALTRQWVYEKRCLVHEYTIHNKFKIAVDTYVDGLPNVIQLFARDGKSFRAPGSGEFLYNIMCKSPAFLPKPFEQYEIKNGRLIYATFKEGDVLDLIAVVLADLLERIEIYIKQNPTYTIGNTLIDETILHGTWRNGWNNDGSKGAVVIKIKKDGSILDENGIHQFSIKEFSVDSKRNRISFMKAGVPGVDNRNLLNILEVKNSELLEGTESGYEIKYTKLLD